MSQKNKNLDALLKLFGFAGLIAVIMLALVLPGNEMFQGYLTLRPSASNCASVSLSSIPTPIEANKGAIVIIKTQPELWSGTFRVLSSGGIVSDSRGNEGSFIETTEKVVNFSGGEADTKITVQAVGEANTQCVASLSVVEAPVLGCTSLEITSSPSPLPENESAEITIRTTPENWDGSFLIDADSGKFLLAEADSNAQGEKTRTLFTSSRKVLYGGGKAGERIVIKGLGEGNENCTNQMEIIAK